MLVHFHSPYWEFLTPIAEEVLEGSHRALAGINTLITNNLRVVTGPSSNLVDSVESLRAPTGGKGLSISLETLSVPARSCDICGIYIE